MRRFNKVRKEIKADPNRRAYTDLALTPMTETDDESLALFTVSDAARAALKKTAAQAPQVKVRGIGFRGEDNGQLSP